MWIVPFALILAIILGQVAVFDIAYAEQKLPEKFVSDRLLVKFKNDVTDSSKKSILESNQATEISEIKPLEIKIIKVPEHALVKIQTLLANNANVEYVEKDFLLEPALSPNDPNYSNQWHLPAINAPNAWDISQGSSSIPIAILDSGVDPNHPDLKNKLVNGYNFFNNNNDWSDVCGHGTKVAGTAAAITDNDIGVAGVSWNSPIIPIRITDLNCYGYYSSMINGIVYAANNGARVANISFQIFNGAALSDAAQYMNDHGGWVVAAAGNTGSNEAYSENPYIISVGATSASNGIASFSSNGPFVDFSAPGSSIYTTRSGGSYSYASGTSFSSPIVAGVIALVIGNDPTLNAQEVYDALKNSAVDKGDQGRDDYYGWGIVDAYAALPQNNSPPIDSVPPTVTITSPQNGVDVGDTFTVKVDASDDVSLINVVLNVDDVFYDQKSSVPYDFVVDSSAWNEGTYEIQAVAKDSGDNSNFDAITVNVIREYNDITPPSVTITSPQNGDKVEDSFIVHVDSSDEISDVNVALYIDDLFFAQSSSPPFVFQIDTTAWIEGSHEIKAISTDANGNTNFDSILVNIIREIVDITPPDVLITNPFDGSKIDGITNVNVAATDNIKVSSVQLYVNNALHDSKSSLPYDFILDSNDFADGSHTVTAKAYDSSDNVNEDSIVVKVEKIIIPPSISITSPSDGAQVNGRVTISAKTMDFTKSPSVKFLIDDSLVFTDSTTPYEFGWHTKDHLSGTHTITVQALNSEGETATDSIKVTIPQKETGKGKTDPPGKNKKSNEVTVELIEQEPNVAPNLQKITDKFLNEGETQSITVIATDKNNDKLKFSVDAPSFVSITNNGDGTAKLVISPSYNDADTYTITVTVTESGKPNSLSDSESFTLAVLESSK